MKSKISQAERLLRLLESYRLECANFRNNAFYEWVELPTILRLGIASHSKIISILRQQGHNIQIERQNKADGQLYTRYRLVRK